MRNVFDLFRKYNINTNRVASLELLNENDYDKYEKILEYLNEKELLSSKFIINRLALILDYSDIKKLRTLENILTNNKLDAYSAMYKANSIMFTDDFDNMIDVIDELGSPEYELDYIRILNQSPSLLECSKPSFIKRAINFLKTNNLDHKRICHKTGIFFEPRSLKGMGEVLTIFKKLFGNELGEELIYKSPSVLAKGSASTIKENFDFISSILGKEKTIEYFSDYTSLLYKASNTRMKENYEMLKKYNIEYVLNNSANVLMFGNASNIEKNYKWIVDNNLNIKIEKAPTILTIDHSQFVRNYNFYKSHNLESCMISAPSILTSTKTTQELEEVYNFFSNIGFTNFSEFPTIISYSNIDEIQEIAKYIVKNIEAPLANKLLKSPTVFTTNFKMLKSSLTFIKENNLTSELEEKPYVLSEAKKDKMDRNKAFLTKIGLTNLASNIIILARGNIENMEKIIEYFSSNNILDLLDKCPTLLTKKYKNVVACIEYFKSQDKMDVVYSTPSLALVKVTELESVGKDIKEAGLEEIAQASPIMYRAKNIKNNSKLVKKETFKGTAGVASVYSTATSKLNDRKKYFDENGLTWLYEKCPSLLSEGNVDTIDESYKCLVELGMEKILDKAPSILTRLKGRDAIINRVNHLYSLGITKEEIIFSSTMLTRYSDEELLSKVNYYRNKKSGR